MLLFVCIDVLHPSQQFFRNVGVISCLSRWNQFSTLLQRIKYLAQGHNAMPPVSLEPVTLQSEV